MGKLRVFLITLLLSCIWSISSFAQSRISSVYGVNLGDSEAVVASKVSGSWQNSQKGERYYKVKNPTLGNCTFEQVTFSFKSGKLSRVYFCSSEGGTASADFHPFGGGLNGYERTLANAQKYQKMYRTMHSDLAEKYGTPAIDDEERAVWKSNGNLIELKYEFEDTVTQYAAHDVWTSVSVKYEVSGTSSSNF